MFRTPAASFIRSPSPTFEKIRHLSQVKHFEALTQNTKLTSNNKVWMRISKGLCFQWSPNTLRENRCYSGSVWCHPVFFGPPWPPQKKSQSYICWYVGVACNPLGVEGPDRCNIGKPSDSVMGPFLGSPTTAKCDHFEQLLDLCSARSASMKYDNAARWFLWCWDPSYPPTLVSMVLNMFKANSVLPEITGFYCSFINNFYWCLRYVFHQMERYFVWTVGGREISQTLCKGFYSDHCGHCSEHSHPTWLEQVLNRFR